MELGEAFWRGFQIAKMQVFLQQGIRSPIDNEERLPGWLYAKSLDPEAAEQGFNFGSTVSTGPEIRSYADLLRAAAHDLSQSRNMGYLERIRAIVTAIEREDSEYFF